MRLGIGIGIGQQQQQGAVNLIVNGTFPTDASGWAPTNAALTSAGGEMVVTADGSTTFALASQTVAVESGADYRLTATYRTGTASSARMKMTGATDYPGTDALETTGVNRTVSVDFTALTDSLVVQTVLGGVTAPGQTGFFDNIAVVRR